MRVVTSLAFGQHVAAMGSQYHAAIAGLQLNPPHPIEELPISKGVGPQLLPRLPSLCYCYPMRLKRSGTQALLRALGPTVGPQNEAFS